MGISIRHLVSLALRSKHELHAWVIIAALAFTGCGVDLEVPREATIACRSDADCPNGFLCKSTLGRCVPPGADDAPPHVVEGTVTLSADSAGRGQTVVLTFSTNEPLSADPLVKLATAAQDAFTRVSASGTDFTYSYTTTGSEGSGIWGVLVDLIDLAGNGTFKQSVATLRFDFAAPSVTSAVGSLLPDATNPLESVAALKDGTTYRLVIATSEPVEEPTARIVCGGDSEELVAVSEPLATIFELELQLTAAMPFADGSCTIEVDLQDLAGNVAEGLEVDSVTVDRTTPIAAQAIHAEHLLHVRFPWGAAQTQGIAVQYVASAGIDRASAVADTPIAAAAFAMTSETLAQARAYTKPLAGDFLGTSQPVTSGWSPIRLGVIDSPEVWLSVVDHAGNESEAMRVPDVLWVATLGRKKARSFVENPHKLDVRSRLTPPEGAADAAEVGDVDGVGLPDGVVASVRGAATWANLQANHVPYRRSAVALFHDAWRRQTIMYGGYMVYCEGYGSGNNCRDTWAWNGFRWQKLSPTDGNGDGDPTGGHSMRAAYDRVRGRALVLGTGDGATWEWDGAGWIKVEITDPEGDGSPDTTWKPVVAYHDLRDEMILYDYASATGGTCSSNCVGRTWRYDPSGSWELLAIASPPARSEPSIAYDAYNGRILLFGGRDRSGSGWDELNDLWAYDGGDWAQVHSGSEPDAPPVASTPTLIYDRLRAVALAYWEDEVPCDAGYCTGIAELDVLDDTWTIPTVDDPEGDGTPDTRNYPSLTYDEYRGEVLLYSGQNWGGSSVDCPDGYCGNLWAWTGRSWERRSYGQQPGNGEPGPRSQHAGAWNPQTRELVVVGGTSGSQSVCPGAATASEACPNTWKFQDGVWFESNTGTQPPARTGAAASFAPRVIVSDRVHGLLMYGGYEASSGVQGGTWFHDGAGWTQLTPATPPPASYMHEMAYDSTRDQVVMVGGSLPATYIWNGSDWRAACTGGCAHPPATSTPALAYDAHRDRVVLFGGYASGCSNQLWEFDPSDETWANKTPAEGPLGRQGAIMVYVPERQKVAMYGGNLCGLWSTPCGADTDTPHCNDLWEWDGERWEKVQMRGVVGDVRVNRLSNAIASHAPGDHDIVVFGGDELPGYRWDYQYRGETWSIDMGGAAAPAHVAQFVIDAAGGASSPGVQVLAADLYWTAAGVGYPGGVTTPGATLFIWDGSWREAHASTAGDVGADGAELHWSIADPTRLTDFLFGEHRVLTASVTSAAPNGTGWAEVQSDYVELRLRYLR